MITPVVLCGIAAKKLFPFINNHLPKKYLQGMTEMEVIESILDATKDYRFFQAPIIISKQNVSDYIQRIIAKQNMGQHFLINETETCNDVSSIAFAALRIMKQDKKGMMLIMPDDKLVLNKRLFKSDLSNSSKFAENDKIVMFTHQPNNISTQYGYVKLGKKIQEHPLTHETLAFIDQPSTQRATRFVKGGEYNWSTGLFLCKASVYLEELEKYNSKLYFAVLKAFSEGSLTTLGFSPNMRNFIDDSQDSLASTIMEKTDKGIAVEGQFKWIDLGEWLAIKNNLPQDESNNTIIGKVEAIDSKGCLIINDSASILTTVGLKDAMVLHTANSTAIIAANKLQELPQLVPTLLAYSSLGPTSNLVTQEGYSIDNITLSSQEEYSVICKSESNYLLTVLQGTLTFINNGKEEVFQVGKVLELKGDATYCLRNQGGEKLNILLVKIANYCLTEGSRVAA